MKFALSILLLSYIVFCASAQTTQSQERLLELPLLTVQGFGNWFVTSNTTTLTVTLYGFGPNATSAQLAVQQQLQFLQNTLSNVTLLNLQLGGLMYYPFSGAPLGLATGESTTATSTLTGRNITGFIATTSLSFSLNASDTATALDALMANGTAFISISSQPNAQAIDDAQIRAVDLAVNDALFKAQAALSRLGICALNFTLINIESPINSLPSVNILSDNLGLALAGGINLPASSSASGSLALSANGNQNNAGAGRMQITADVLLTLFHTSCSTPGAILDLTANLTQPSVPGEITSPSSPIASPSSPSSPASPASPGSPGTISSRRRRAFW